LGALLTYQHPSKTTSPSILPEYIQLQQKFNNIRDKLALSQADNDMKQAQINSLQDALTNQQKQIETLNKRLHSFESILEARKARTSQILQASIQPINAKQMEYSLTLVKGGNYPRYTRGFIQFITHDNQGKLVKLLFENHKDKLPYKMETHTFLRGKLHWPEMISITETTQTLPLTAVLLNTKGKELSRKTCTFEE
jgi:hypothetical protein